ncbi:MAG TPA: type II secretion system protein N [Allosphingosinicella sp.]|nr:type II secretion system protein N [Allosphingosinicella sp.]
MSPDRRKFWLGGGLLASVAALYVTLTVGDGPPAAAAAPALAQPPDPAPLATAPLAPPAPAPDLSGLRLHGLTATGAIIATAGGQRLVRLGREVVAGVTLTEVRQHHAVLSTSAGLFELGLLGGPHAAAVTAVATAAAAPANISPAPAAARQTEVLQYRLGLAPRRGDGRITGFAVRPGAEMPLLRRAGLQAGDVLIGVNGQTFDSEEKVLELASEIAGAYTAEFEFERNGRRMRASLPVNPRP